jgi:hypothetical protein
MFDDRMVIEGNLPPSLDFRPKQRILIISEDQSFLTHGFHKYPAKFFPELPRWAIRKYATKGPVLDPMAGSGTVNVEALLCGIPSIAIDVDPFAQMLTRVKVTPLQKPVLESTWEWLRSQLHYRHPASDLIIPDFPNRDEIWFKKEISKELGIIKGAIEKMPSVFGFESSRARKYKDFYYICMSSIIRAVSNADDHCTRTVVRKRLNKKVEKGDAFQKFKETTQANIQNMIRFSKVCPSHIKVDILAKGDARDTGLPNESVELAVTSPPYINAVDYTRTHQLEMYWLELIDPNNGPLADMKRLHIGTESVFSKDYRDLKTFGLPKLDKKLASIFQVDPRRSFIVYKYFVDMKADFEEMLRVLVPGGRYVVVIGNNTIRGHLIPNHEFFVDIATDVGFQLENHFVSEIIRHFIKIPREERINDDWVLIFRKPERS